MDSNVVSLGGAQLPASEPVESVVEHLEDLLERARSGQITAVAAAFTEPSGAGAYSVVGYVGGYSMIGALECARATLTDAARADGDG